MRCESVIKELKEEYLNKDCKIILEGFNTGYRKLIARELGTSIIGEENRKCFISEPYKPFVDENYKYRVSDEISDDFYTRYDVFNGLNIISDIGKNREKEGDVLTSIFTLLRINKDIWKKNAVFVYFPPFEDEEKANKERENMYEKQIIPTLKAMGMKVKIAQYKEIKEEDMDNNEDKIKMEII